MFIVPTQLEVALYDKIIKGTAVKDLLSGGAKGHQLALLMVLRKLCNTPGLLMDQVKAVRSSLSLVLCDVLMNLGGRARDSRYSMTQLRPYSLTLLPPISLSLVRPSSLSPFSHAKVSSTGKLLVLGSLLEALHTAGNEKIVVVSNFTSTLDIIGKHCKALKYSFCRLDG